MIDNAMNQISPRRPTVTTGFTLVEMLVAMAVTLLMMAALARAFAFVGDRVRDGRATVKLSNQLRDITTRLKDELNRCTVSLEPNNGGEDPPGYFLYYEGPMTNASSSIFPATTEVIDGRAVPPKSRYGDLDDYLAFTAVAKPGTWFTGKVPRFVLSGVAAETDPVFIRSKYAEIVYFTNPDRDSTGTVVDADTDGLPDRVSLYRRELLIRPDLNLNSGAVHNLAAGANWQTGMADVYQLCDLSVRRGLMTNGSFDNNVIIANSLEDLSKPHNRFGHVRAPGGLLGVAGTSVSMPILALEEPIALIANASTATPVLRPVDSSSGNENVVLEARWSGFLRREYVLTGVRQGEDLIANNCRGLDLQVFDPEVRFALASGNVVVGPGDVGYREALLDTTPVLLQGGFVDLAYPFLAGGPMRGWKSMQVVASGTAVTNQLTTATAPITLDLFETPFSGVFRDPAAATGWPTTTTAAVQTYAESLLMSGRVVIASNQVVLFQPAFDTFTSSYERDGFPQDRRYVASPTDRFFGTIWNPLASPPPVPSTTDLGSDGLDNNTNADVGADDPRERETSAPFTSTPAAIRVSVRVEDVGSRLVRQMSVVHSAGH